MFYVSGDVADARGRVGQLLPAPQKLIIRKQLLTFFIKNKNVRVEILILKKFRGK